MEAGTQKSAANAEESAAAAEELNAQSKQLTQVAAGLGDMVGLSDTTVSLATKRSPLRAARAAQGLKIGKAGVGRPAFTPAPTGTSFSMAENDFESF
jgi:hypothetical protein